MEVDERADRPPAMTGLIVWLLLAMVAGLIALFVAFGGVRWPPVEKSIAVGRPLSTLELEGLTGTTDRVSLQDLRGKVAIVNFWGTWCPPCVEEFPHVTRLAERYAENADFRALLVSCPAGGSDLATLRSETQTFLESSGSSVPTFADPSGQTRAAVSVAAGRSPGEFAYPTTIVLDREGVIRAFAEGFSTAGLRKVEQAIDEALIKEKRDGP